MKRKSRVKEKNETRKQQILMFDERGLVFTTLQDL